MKTSFTLQITALLALLLLIPLNSNAQEKSSEMRIQIIKDGETIKDTVYALDESKDPEEVLQMVESSMNRKPFFHHSGDMNFEFSYDDMLKEFEIRHDSLMKDHQVYVFKHRGPENFEHGIPEHPEGVMPEMPENFEWSENEIIIKNSDDEHIHINENGGKRKIIIIESDDKNNTEIEVVIKDGDKVVRENNKVIIRNSENVEDGSEKDIVKEKKEKRKDKKKEK
jgi:hypothetical protein